MLEWIKVEERLPPATQFGVSDDLLIFAHDPQWRFSYQIGYYCPDEDRWYFPHAMMKMTPTHWMALSPPTKEERKQTGV